MFSFNAIAEQRRLTIKCEQLEKYLTKSDQKSRAFQAHAKDYVRKMEMTYVSTVLDMIGGMKCDEKKCHPILRSIVSRLDPLYAKHILAMHILKHSGETTYPLPTVIADKSARDILSACPKDDMSPCWDYIFMVFVHVKIADVFMSRKMSSITNSLQQRFLLSKKGLMY